MCSSDLYVAIFTAAERHWHSMCHMLGRPALLLDPELSSTIGRAKNMAEVDDIVGSWTLTRTKEEVLRALNVGTSVATILATISLVVLERLWSTQRNQIDHLLREDLAEISGM